MLVYLLALGSPTHPVGPEAWAEWTSTYDQSWGKHFGQEYLGFAPLFGHQYTHVWLDFRDIQDAYMRGAASTTSRTAAAPSTRSTPTRSPIRGTARTTARRSGASRPATARPTWSSRSPAVMRAVPQLRRARHRRSAGTHDDCTLAPTAAVASMPFAPEIAIPAILDMHKRFGNHIYAQVRLSRRLQPELRLRRTAAARPLHPGLRLGRRRLPRHRPGRRSSR